MNAITFDTLASVQRLRTKGITQEHAEAIAAELRTANEMDVSHLTTKEEFATFKSDLKDDIKTLDSKIDLSVSALKADIRELELRMTIKIGTMIFTLGGILIAIKFFAH